jgi:GDP-4-dehydro-6-deoxy-D-mannose reductase
MRALVIGADGFVGRWLVRHLAESGDEVWAAGGPRFVPPPDGAIESLTGSLAKSPTDSLSGSLSGSLSVDVRDAEAVAACVRRSAPEAIYYLAGVSGHGARNDPELAIGISVNGAMNVLAACAGLAAAPRLLYVSTAYVYGPAPDALAESAAERPVDVYSAAKLAGERALGGLAPALGAELVVTRPFNHIGPGQREDFLVPTIARQIASGGREVQLRTSDVVRDFTDVRDVVRAYRLVMKRGEAGAVYNVASGRGVSVAELVRVIADLAGVRVELSTTEPGGDGADTLVGDATRLRDLGWSPARSLEETLGDVLGEWRERRT